MPILVQVAMALGAAARAGVVHQTSPANILVRPDGMAETDRLRHLSRSPDRPRAWSLVPPTPRTGVMGETAAPIGDPTPGNIAPSASAAGRRLFTGGTQVGIAFSHVNDPVPSAPDSSPSPSPTSFCTC